MEPLWSPVVATGGNQRQIGCARKRRKQARTVAAGSDRLRAKFRGKEGVRRFESVRGLCKSPAKRGFFFGPTRTIHSVRWVWSPLWNLQSEKCLRQGRKTATLTR